MTDQDIKRLADLNRVASYLLSIAQSGQSSPQIQADLALRGYDILAPYLLPPSTND